MPDRILTTHVGSLPRGAEVTELLFAAERGEAGRSRSASTASLRQRSKTPSGGRSSAGIDHRLRRRDEQDQLRHLHQGPDQRVRRRQPAHGARPTSRPFRAFSSARPRAAARRAIAARAAWARCRRSRSQPLEDDIRRFAEARAAHGNPAGFMNAASPGVIALFQPNDFYPDDDSLSGGARRSDAARIRGDRRRPG